MRSPSGVPAPAVPVKISVSHTNEKSITVNTDDDGVANYAFNVVQSAQSISVEVSILKIVMSHSEFVFIILIC